MDYLKHYIPVKHDEWTHIKVSVSYSLGGMSCFTYQKNERGIYEYISPVKRERHSLDNGDAYVTESTQLFKGFKKLVLELARKSDKKGQEVADKIRSEIESKSGDTWNMAYKLANEMGMLIE